MSYDSLEDEDAYIELSASTVLLHKKATLFKITVIASLFFIAMGTAMSPEVILQISKICRDQFPNETNDWDDKVLQTRGFENQNCDSDLAQKLNGELQSYIMASLCLLSILTSGKVGEFSDRVGRKKALLLLFSVFFIEAFVLILILSDVVPFQFGLFVMARSISGLVGGAKSALGILRSYVIDIVEPSERIASLSIITGTLFLGIAIGPIISFIINKSTHGKDIYSLYFQIILQVVIIFLLFWFVPETHYSHSKNKVVRPGKSLFELFKALRLLWIKKNPFDPSYRSKRIKVFILLFINIIANSSMITVGQALVLYSTLRFEWGSPQIGLLLSISGITKAVISFVLTPAYMRYLRTRGHISNSVEAKNGIGKMDIYNIRFATLIGFIEVFIIVATNSAPWVFVASIVGSFATINGSVIQASVVKLCHENIVDDNGVSSDTKLGEFFGALGLVENIFAMFMTTSTMMIFSKTATDAPKSCFVVLLLLIALALITSCFLKPDGHFEINEEDFDENFQAHLQNETLEEEVMQ